MSIVLTSAALFAIGLYGVLTRRDLIALLASLEVMLSGPLVLLVGVGSANGGGSVVEATGLLVIVLAAAEASVGLALLVALARSTGSADATSLAEEDA